MASANGPNEFSLGLKDFPMELYKIDGILIGNLDYLNKETRKEKIPDLSIFRTIVTKSALKLVNFNQTTGHYKFKLTIVPVIFSDMSVNGTFYDPISVKGVVFFENDKNEFVIEGDVSYKNKLPTLTTNDNATFNLSIKNNVLVLEAKRNIPVTVRLDN